MKTIKNEKLIKRNGTISNWTNLGAVAIFGVAMYATFKLPHFTTTDLYGHCLYRRLILMQIGMYLGIALHVPAPG
jgi:hypothetical protein